MHNRNVFWKVVMSVRGISLLKTVERIVHRQQWSSKQKIQAETQFSQSRS